MQCDSCLVHSYYLIKYIFLLDKINIWTNLDFFQYHFKTKTQNEDLKLQMPNWRYNHYPRLMMPTYLIISCCHECVWDRWTDKENQSNIPHIHGESKMIKALINMTNRCQHFHSVNDKVLSFKSYKKLKYFIYLFTFQYYCLITLSCILLQIQMPKIISILKVVGFWTDIF